MFLSSPVALFWQENTNLRGSITVWLTSIWTGLDLTKKEKMLLIQQNLAA